MKTRWNLLATCCAAALLAVAAGAAEPAEENQTSATTSDRATTTDAGAESADADADAVQVLTVTRDPATGALGAPGHLPAAELGVELRRMLAEKLSTLDPSVRAGLKSGAVHRTDGVIEYRLGLEHLSFAVVRVGEDGRLEHDCAETDAAVEILAQPLATEKVTDATPEDR